MGGEGQGDTPVRSIVENGDGKPLVERLEGYRVDL